MKIVSATTTYIGIIGNDIHLPPELKPKSIFLNTRANGLTIDILDLCSLRVEGIECPYGVLEFQRSSIVPVITKARENEPSISHVLSRFTPIDRTAKSNL
ncbi:hypothetical protein ACMFMG_007383 [Clarireedia jacksonii]